MAIGMVIPDLANSIYAAIARGVEERAEPAGYVVLIAAGSAASRLGQVAGRVDGLLVAVATHESVAPAELTAEGLPVVLVNRREDWGVPTVTVDDEAGAALATRHLLSLGHRRIAHLAGPRNADTSLRRLRGYEAAMREAHTASHERLIVEASHDEAGGYAATSRVLSTTPRATAIFAGNILAAIGAIAAARSCGLRVPEDVSVVGLHDLPIAGYLDPPVTTLRMPLEEMGRQAVDTLLRLVAGESGVEHVEIASEPELVLRGSTAPPGAT
jgi:LacI family transcriptional regulator